MRKFTLLFAVLLSLVGVTVNAQKPLPYSYGFEDFNLATDGWTTYFGTSLTKNNNECKIVGDAKKTGSYGFRFSSYQTSGANAQYLISPELNATSGVNVSFYYKVSNANGTEKFKVGYSTTDTDVASFTWGDEISTNSTSWLQYENSFPAGTKYVAIYYYANYQYRLYVDDFSFTSMAAGPALAVADGSKTINSGYNYNFGVATAGATHYFTLSNPGTENLTVNIEATNGFGISNTSLTLGAKGASLLTVTMPDATATGTVTITPTNSDIDPFIINVSGTIRDTNKLYEGGFTALPEDWTTTGTWYYSSANGAYTTAWYLSSNARLITPLLNVAENETFIVEAKGYSTDNTSYQHLQMQYSADGSSWTNFDAEPTLDPSDWQTFAFTGVPAGKYYIAINASQADIRMFYGGSLPQEPKMVVTQPASLDFGVITEATAKTFTIANTGLATLEGINVTSSNDVFTISNAPTSLAAGASQEVTITMAASTVGALNSNITVSATDMENVVFTVTGIVLPDGLYTETFADGLPTNWVNASWTFANGEATGKSSSAYLTTPKLIFSEGDMVVIKAKRFDSDTSDYLTVQGSSDNGATWTAYSKKLQNADGLTYPDYGTIVLTDIPTTVNKLRFVGYYVVVDEIAGLTYAPVLTVTKGVEAVASGSTCDFGECASDEMATYSFANTGAGTISITNVAITGEGAEAYSTNWKGGEELPFNLDITRTYNAAREGASAAVVTVTTTVGTFVINVTGTDKAANAPELSVTPDEAASFGAVTEVANKVYTVTNSGTGTLTVNIASDDDMFTVSPAQLTDIAAGDSKTFTVTFTPVAETYGVFAANITVTPTYDAEAAKVIAATAQVKDPNVWSEDFSGNSLPDGWEITNSTYWKVEDNMLKGSYRYGYYDLITPSLVVEEGQSMTFDYRMTSTYRSLDIQYSKDNGAWATLGTISYSDLTLNQWYTYTIENLAAGNYKFRFSDSNYDLKNFEGFKLNLNDPQLGVYATFDGENTYSNAVTTGTKKDLGWAQDAQSFTYYIKNDKTGTLIINEVTNTNDTDFTNTVINESNKNIASGATLAFTVTMSAASIGEKTATITLSTNVGDFEIPVKGFIYGDRNLVDFTDASQYQGWTGVNVTDNAATLSSTAIQTMPLRAIAGEKLYVEIKGSSSWGSKSFSYSYYRDGAWSEENALVASTSNSVADQIFTIEDISDAENQKDVQIRFTGAGLSINHIYGFEALTAPVMALDKMADSYNFGMQTANAEYVITVTNTGTATLNNLAAALTTGTNYTVTITKPEGESTTSISEGKATVPAGQQAIITVTQVYNAANGLATLSDVLTITGDDVTGKTINLSGQTRDADKWYVDFATSSPEGILSSTGWSISSYYGYASVSTESALVSQTLTLAANEAVQFDAKKMTYGVASLKVRHSLNGGISWSEYTDFTETEDFNSSAYKTMEYSVGNTDASAVAMIEFLGANVYLDNIYGGTLNNESPMIQVKKYVSSYNQPVVATGFTHEFGSIFDETSATYTITNIGGGTLTITSPITTITGDATAAVNETSLGAGESATLTITMSVVTPYGEKSGAVTVKTSLGDFVINYTATTMNPNALSVTDGTFPEGWYNGGWSESTYNGYVSKSYSGSIVDFVTQKLEVAGVDDVLKYQACKYSTYSGYSTSTALSVSYSQDRVNWTEYADITAELTGDFKDFEVKGLPAGEYYLKFSGRNAEIDNIIGWTKVSGIEHDLYVTNSSFPTTTKDAEEDVTISATVTSLRAAEAGVYAKLFINGEEAQTAEAQDVALNGTKTFSFDYAMPATPGTHSAQIKVYYSDDTEAFATAVNDMKVYYVLNEASAPATLNAGTFDIKLNRTFAAGWNTVCLPFVINDVEGFFGSGAKAYALSSHNDDELFFSSVSALEARFPYIVYVPTAITETINVTDAIINNPSTEAGYRDHEVAGDVIYFRGTYAPIAAGTWPKAADGDLIYGVTTDGHIKKAGASASIKGFRAYFDIPANAEVKGIVFDDDTATGLSIIDGEIVSSEAVYDLNGRRVNKTQKGVYIVNGKKVVVK